VYVSDANEVELEERLAAGADVADLALRTYLCGARIDGFDAYWEHLSGAVSREEPPN
jgi:hypothetical protein